MNKTLARIERQKNARADRQFATNQVMQEYAKTQKQRAQEAEVRRNAEQQKQAARQARLKEINRPPTTKPDKPKPNTTSSRKSGPWAVRDAVDRAGGYNEWRTAMDRQNTSNRRKRKGRR